MFPIFLAIYSKLLKPLGHLSHGVMGHILGLDNSHFVQESTVKREKFKKLKMKMGNISSNLLNHWQLYSRRLSCQHSPFNLAIFWFAHCVQHISTKVVRTLRYILLDVFRTDEHILDIDFVILLCLYPCDPCDARPEVSGLGDASSSSGALLSWSKWHKQKEFSGRHFSNYWGEGRAHCSK